MKYINNVLDIVGVSKAKYCYMIGLISLSGLLDAFVIALIPVCISATFNESSVLVEKFDFLLPDGVSLAELSLIILLLASTVKVFFSLAVQHWIVVFISRKQVDLTKRVVRSFFSLNYVDYLKQEPSKLIQIVVSSIPRFIEEGLHSSIRLVTEIVVFLLITLTLFLISPSVAITLFGLMLSLAILFATLTRKLSKKYSQHMLSAQEQVIETARQSIDGFVETKVHDLGNYFLNKIDLNATTFASTGAKFYVLQAVPRYLLEFVLVLSFALAAFWSFESNLSLVDVSAVAGAFGIGIVRLIPVINNIINYFNKIRFSEPICNDIQELLCSLAASSHQSFKGQDKQITKHSNKVNFLGHSVKLNNLSFTYNTGQGVLKNINVDLKIGDVLCIVGASGSGKTTLLKIILGLLSPTSGSVEIDGRILVPEEVLDFARQNVVYIPQSCFLLSTNLLENVGLGLNEEEIDSELVKTALDKVGLSDLYLESHLGLKRLVGDSGRFLSGGQKHRLALARVIYFDKKIIILDEPTAALDLAMTNAIGELIREFSKDRIVIVVTHDMELVKFCTKNIQLTKDAFKEDF